MLAAIGFFILSAVLCYYLYIPIRPGISRPWKLRSILLLQKFVVDIVKVGALLKLGTEVHLTRSILDFMIRFTPKCDPSGDKGVEVQEQYFGTIRTLTFTPPGYKENGPGAALVHYHGGGWMFGKPEYSRNLLVHLAKTLNVFIVSVDYRLAPEHPYPIPLEDCLYVTVQLLSTPQTYGVNPTRVALAGESAGGNLAAAVALKLLHDPQYSKLPKVKLVALFFPVLQAFDFNTPSYQVNQVHPLITPKNSISAWQNYMHGVEELDIVQDVLNKNHSDQAIYNELHLKINWNMIPAEYCEGIIQRKHLAFIKHAPKAHNIFNKALTDPYLAPLVASDEMLKDFPPTYMLTCEYDGLRDDGIMFKERLRKLAVPLTFVNYKFYHGITGLIGFGFTEAQQSVNDFVHFCLSSLV